MYLVCSFQRSCIFCVFLREHISCVFFFKEHVSCVFFKKTTHKIHKNKNSISAYILHTLNNKHKYWNIEQTIELLKPCKKVVKMNGCESFFINVLQKQNLLIEERKVIDPNHLFELSQDVTLHNYIHVPTFCSSLLPTSTPHTHNQGNSIKLIHIIHHLPYNIIILLYFYRN